MRYLLMNNGDLSQFKPYLKLNLKILISIICVINLEII